MPDDTLQQKIQEARRAMTGEPGKPASLFAQNLLTKRATTLAAPVATTDESTLSPEALAKKRLEARRAMESYEQKKRREMREQAEAEARATAAKIAELKGARIKLEEKRKADANNEQATLLAKAAEQQANYQTRLAESKAVAASIINRENEPVDTYRTLRTDVHEQVTTGGLTMAKIALEEEARRRLSTLPRETSTRPKMYTALAVVSALLVLVSIGALVVTRVITSPTQTTVSPLVIDSIIFADNHQAFPIDTLTSEAIQTTLRRFVTEHTRPGAITNIYPTQTVTTEEGSITSIVSATTFLQQAGITLPSGFTHFLETRFMVGITQGETSTTSAPLYVFKTRSFENTLDSLLREENSIIGNLLTPVITPENRAVIQTGTFRDVIIKNIDTRILTTSTGQVVALYGFLDRNTLAITTSRESFEHIIDAYRTPSPTTKP